MSRMKLDRKPPLAKSPIRLRQPSRVLRSGATSLQTPPGSLTKSQKPSRMWDTEESELRPEYRSISCELRALAKMVGKEFTDEDKSVSANSIPLFERGRLYDEYSARRNERLRKKYGGTGEEFKSAFKQKLGVAVESAKRGSGTRKLESMKKSVSAAYAVETTTSETPRYMLRSMSKENKKPPLACFVFCSEICNWWGKEDRVSKSWVLGIMGFEFGVMMVFYVLGYMWLAFDSLISETLGLEFGMNLFGGLWVCSVQWA